MWSLNGPLRPRLGRASQRWTPQEHIGAAGSGLAEAGAAGSSCAGRLSPEPLALHDVPQLAQVGARDAVVGLELQRPQVLGLRLRQLPVQVEDGAQVHQGGRVLRRKG